MVRTYLIFDYMEQHNLSKEDFAKKCNTSVLVLDMVLNDKRTYSEFVLFKIAKVLEIEVDRLLCDFINCMIETLPPFVKSIGFLKITGKKAHQFTFAQ